MSSDYEEEYFYGDEESSYDYDDYQYPEEAEELEGGAYQLYPEDVVSSMGLGYGGVLRGGAANSWTHFLQKNSFKATGIKRSRDQLLQMYRKQQRAPKKAPRKVSSRKSKPVYSAAKEKKLQAFADKAIRARELMQKERGTVAYKRERCMEQKKGYNPASGRCKNLNNIKSSILSPEERKLKCILKGMILNSKSKSGRCMRSGSKTSKKKKR